jgi:hypothetical protein
LIDAPATAPQEEAAADLGLKLKAMFQAVAEAPLPDELLSLVDDLEAAEAQTYRAPEPRAIG